MNDQAPIERILHATDFSENATVALEWSIEIARLHGARLDVVHAVDAPPGEDLPDALREAVTSGLATVEAAGGAVAVSTEHRTGRAWKVVLDAAAEHDSDLIVVGARGQTSYAHLLVGSTADRILRAAPVPVLTVHATRREQRRFKTVLIATDFAQPAQDAMTFATRLVGRAEPPPRIVLLHAWQPLVSYEFGMSAPIASPLDTDDEQARAVLTAEADALRDLGFEVEAVVRSGYPATVVRKEAETIGADLIAVGTHGRPGLERFMIGSIAERIVHHAACPVLTSRAIDTAAAPPGARATSASRT